MNVTETKTKMTPVQETFMIAGLLAVVGGFLDAYTYILRGGIFANAQTGNVVLLAVNLAEGEFKKAAYYIVPIFAFVLGVFVTDFLKYYFTRRGFQVFEHFIIVVEIILLAVIGFIPTTVPHGLVNVTISFLCSLQVNAFRKVHDAPYASTMCTGNLRSGTDKLFKYVIKRDKKAGRSAGHYFGVILLFIVGAILGTMLAISLGPKSIWICCGILGIVWGVMAKGNVPSAKVSRSI